jgi:hypothetical protein
MRKLLPAVVAAMALLLPTSANAWPQPPPGLNESKTEVNIDNQTSDGTWVTLYKYVKVGPVKTGKEQNLLAFCAEPHRKTTRVILIDADKVRGEVKPGCNGALRWDRSHLTHHWSVSMGKPGQAANFRRFDGRVFTDRNGYHFDDITPN